MPIRLAGDRSRPTRQGRGDSAKDRSFIFDSTKWIQPVIGHLKSAEEAAHGSAAGPLALVTAKETAEVMMQKFASGESTRHEPTVPDHHVAEPVYVAS